MAYQNVGTPRFYIDTLLFYKLQGKGTPVAGEDVSTLNPAGGVSRNFSANGEAGRDWLDYGFSSPTSLGAINYIAFLGHDQGDATILTFRLSVNNSMQNLHDTNTVTELVNYSVPGAGGLNGFSIGLVDYNSATGTFTDNSADFDEQTSVNFSIRSGAQGAQGSPYRIGAASIGRVYSMPHSPDLSLTMSHEYDGIKTVETKGGATLSDRRYHKPPMWGDLEAWQLGGWNRLSSGRRVWDLSFSYISDVDIEPYNYYGVKYFQDTGAGIVSAGTDNWFQNVIYYTNGGQLPFIFQPDKDATYVPADYTVPEFAICRFDMSTFKREQVANSVYNIKVKIVESW